MTDLREILRAACDEEGCSLKDLTVLAPVNDPFRVGSDAEHRDGQWFAEAHREALRLKDRPRIHFRGVHYAAVELQLVKPSGAPYANTDEDWRWLQERAGDAARWLGYTPFEAIVDERNAEPVIRLHEEPEPEPYLEVGAGVELPDDLKLRIGATDFRGVQSHKLVLFGEKASLEDELAPLAEQYGADLYLPKGEASDTMIHQLASVGALDGRRMVVFYLSDCDPAGWQMAVSVARKLQAFKALEFPELDFELRPIALTPDQVREHALPSSPMKSTERRADKWFKAMGVQQTEIDSIATLRPALLREIVHEAIRPFYDSTLDQRVAEARSAWNGDAHAALAEQLDPAHARQLNACEADLEALRGRLDEINDALDVGDFDLPALVIPAAASNGSANGKSLIDSDWGYAEQARRLIAHKAYANGGRS